MNNLSESEKSSLLLSLILTRNEPSTRPSSNFSASVLPICPWNQLEVEKPVKRSKRKSTLAMMRSYFNFKTIIVKNDELRRLLKPG